VTDDFWSARSTSGRPLTINGVAKMHRQQWATATRNLRAEWTVLWIDAGLARVAAAWPIEVRVIPLHRTRRTPQDVGACAPAAKAAIDALVDVGFIPDDDPEWVRRVTFCAPDVGEVDGLELHISRFEG
jgi:hypothetical protein